MKGWEFKGTHIPLEVVEKPDPVAKPGYVVLKTLAGGLCHSDVSALEHESWMPSFNIPVIMGHECCGRIVEIGEGVEGFEVGDVVSVCPLHAKDGTTPGYTRDGGYGTMTTAPVEQLVKVPAGITYAQAAAATDAGATAYHAVVTVGEIKPGMKVGVIGVGGLGQIGARVVVVKGCELYVATRKPEAQQLAWELGATDVKSSITEFANVGLDVIIDFAGGGTTTEDAVNVVKPHGRVVLVGMAKDFANVNTMSIIMKEVTLVGSQGSFPSELGDVMDMMATGALDPILNTISFDQIGEGIDMLTEGKVKGRLVCVYED